MKSNESDTSNENSNTASSNSAENPNMITTDNTNTSTPDPLTADIVTAVQYGFYERVVELIGADPQLAVESREENITLLHWAAINNRVDIAKYLISKGAQIDRIGGSLQSTPLQWAIRDGKLKMTVLLLSYNADINIFDTEGYACIHLAAIFGHIDIMAYLVAKGVDVNLPDKNGMTPLMHVASRCKDRDLVQILVRLGASLNEQNPNNRCTALHYAVLVSNYPAIRILIEAGAKTNIRNANNEDIFDISAKSINSRALLYFLAQLIGANQCLSKYFQFDRSTRRFGTKLFPYVILIAVAVIVDLSGSIIYKIGLFVALLAITRLYFIILFDENTDRYLPISIAQAFIFWLYTYYLYYFLPYVHVISFSFIGLAVCTYFSWTNYYLTQKVDPGYIALNTDQQSRTIIQLVEQNLFDAENFCTWCLIRRPLRSKHCRECRRCVTKFDHHCPWVDNCVGDKNLRYFTGFLCFTALCLTLYLHGAYLFYRQACNISTLSQIKEVFFCKPSALWFAVIAAVLQMWITGLFFTIILQVLFGFTTNERMNMHRYKHFKSSSSPFSFGWRQNLIDLWNRRVLCYSPSNIDWTSVYTIEDYEELIPTRLKHSINRKCYDVI